MVSKAFRSGPCATATLRRSRARARELRSEKRLECGCGDRLPWARGKQGLFFILVRSDVAQGVTLQTRLWCVLLFSTS